MKILKRVNLIDGSTMDGEVIAKKIDIPAKLPADGGNADTIGGKSPSDFAPASHVGSGGNAHAVATTSTAGFISPTDKSKLDNVQPNAINQDAADDRYVQQSGGNMSGDLTFGSRFSISYNSSQDSLEFKVT